MDTYKENNSQLENYYYHLGQMNEYKPKELVIDDALIAFFEGENLILEANFLSPEDTKELAEWLRAIGV